MKRWAGFLLGLALASAGEGQYARVWQGGTGSQTYAQVGGLIWYDGTKLLNSTRLYWDSTAASLNLKGTLCFLGATSGSVCFIGPATGGDGTAYIWPGTHPPASPYVLASSSTGVLSWIPRSPLTTKGDIWAYSTTNGRFPVGSNDKVTIADSSQTFGIRWDTLASIGGISGSLTAGYIPFADGASHLADTTMHWDNTLHLIDGPEPLVIQPPDGSEHSGSTILTIGYDSADASLSGPCYGFRTHTDGFSRINIARICAQSVATTDENPGKTGDIYFQLLNHIRPPTAESWTNVFMMTHEADVGGDQVHSLGACTVCANPGRSYFNIGALGSRPTKSAITDFDYGSVGPYTDIHLSIDRDGIQAMSDGSTASEFKLNKFGGAVGIGSGGAKFYGSSSGSRIVTIPATGGTGTLVLPPDHCGSGEVWIDNGSGVMSCTSVAGGSLGVVSSDATLTDLAPVIGDGGARKVKTVAALPPSVGGTGANNTATSGRYLKGSGTTFATSSGSASGTGSCTNQVVSALNSDAAPTCVTVPAASGGTGASNTATSGRYLKGDGTNFNTSSGSASGVGTCSAGQVVTALSSDAAPTCTAVTTAAGLIPVTSPAVSFQKNGGTGSTAYMTVPDNTALDGTTGISISVWVKYRGYVTSATTQGLFTKATAAGGTGAAACGDYSFYITTSSAGLWSPQFGINGSGSCTYGATAALTRTFGPADASGRLGGAGEWMHLVGTYSTAQGNAKLYLDGVLVATSGAYSTAIGTTGTIGLLCSWFDKSVPGRSCNSSIDDLRIYKNAALSAADVTILYNAGRGQFALNALSANETVVWRFDEGTGTTATDAVAGLVLTSVGAQAVDWVRGNIPDR